VALAWSFLCLTLACGTVYALYPGTPIGLAAFVVPVLGCFVGIEVGVRRNRPALRRPWRLFQVALLLALVGSVLRVGAGDPFSVLGGDLLALTSYPLVAAGLLQFLRRREARAQSDVLADGVLVVVAMGLLAWVLLVSPALADASRPLAQRLLAGVFPVLDTVLLFLVVRLALVTSSRVRAISLLVGGFLCLLVGDAGYAVHAVRPLPVPPELLDAPYLGMYGLVGSAALHPSMRVLTSGATPVVRPLPGGRVALVSVAVAVPAFLVVLRPLSRPADRLVFAVSILTLAGVVLWRTVRAINQHAASEFRLEEQATHDTLTGLPNRTLLLERLADALAHARGGAERTVALLFCDLDGFKFVNDSWGHSVGDELLLVAGARLRAAGDGGDLVARLGGDEFVVVHEGAEGAEGDGGVPALAQRLLTTFSLPFVLSIGEIFISASIGVATSQGRAADCTPEELIRDADTAMYRAKSEGRNRWILFDQSMRSTITERLRVESELRRGLERDELRVHYQPIVRVENGALHGFEALVRWEHPERGLLPPGAFIPFIEDTDLILPVGERVLRLAAAELVGLRAVLGQEHLTVSVNVAARQLRDPGFVDVVRRALDDCALPGYALVLEITESTMVEDSEATRAKLAALRGLGVGLAVDDFGTGYSSLRYLKKFPVTCVKIDRAFVDGLGSDADDEVIVEAVLAMAHALGLEVVAEGVETPPQRERLRALGCDLAQGYLFGRPASVRSMTLPSIVGAEPSAPRKLIAK
jgi:diguanylate cyclase (GGDEF)-like protein